MGGMPPMANPLMNKRAGAACDQKASVLALGGPGLKGWGYIQYARASVRLIDLFLSPLFYAVKELRRECLGTRMKPQCDVSDSGHDVSGSATRCVNKWLTFDTS